MVLRSTCNPDSKLILLGYLLVLELILTDLQKKKKKKKKKYSGAQIIPMYWHRTGLIAYKYKTQILINDLNGENL